MQGRAQARRRLPRLHPRVKVGPRYLTLTLTNKASRGGVRYCDAGGAATEAYPANPNGSPAGIAALTSPCGRHLAIMPHPERCFLGWQQPWAPADAGIAPDGPGPWLRLFQNARDFLVSARA